ncbi:MAG: hypothetical protein IJE90_06625 [Clostridia bacterium]|nr:hypothetical protein [Clostridia bacterium]
MESSKIIIDSLKDSDIKFEHYTHPPLTNVLERKPLGLDYGGYVCKNLLITTRNEARFLLCMLPAEKEADLKAMRDHFHTARLCFASDDALLRLLDQVKGSVGVLSAINDVGNVCEIVLDSALKDAERIAMHPGVITETVVLSGAELEKFLTQQNKTVHYFDF